MKMTSMPSPPLAFRSAVAADAPAIVALVESAYRGESSREGWTTEADLLDGQRTDLDGVRAAIAAEGVCIVLAEREGELLACAQLERDADTVWFGMYAVRPQRQGQGIGAALLAEGERIARDEWHGRQMRMSVIWTRAELIAFYARRGFRDTGERKPFPYGEPRFGLPRRGDLHFNVYAKDL
jgi:ribosomal protein S18 acetylase RimI-like enzyme